MVAPMSFPPPTPQQQPTEAQPDKSWKGIPVWSYIVGPAVIVFYIWYQFSK